jgi:hypothetical protein
MQGAATFASSSDGAPPACAPLRLLTLNVHGWHNEEDGSFTKLVALLSSANPDVIALQRKRRPSTGCHSW